MIHTELRQFNLWELTKEGIEIAEKGSHEVRVFMAVDRNNGSLHSELMVCPLAISEQSFA